MNENDELIAAALSHETEIEPSPAFARRVMTAVRGEAALPPLAFPARRFALALLSLAVTFAAAIVEPSAAAAAFSQSLLPLVAIIGTTAVGFVLTEHRRLLRRH